MSAPPLDTDTSVRTAKPKAQGSGPAKEALLNALTELLNAVIELLKVKSIITFIVISGITYLAVKGDIPREAFMTIGSAVITYYFARPAEK